MKKFVHNRRVQVLKECISSILPNECSLLDVGCGDGLLSKNLILDKNGLNITGLDVIVRENAHIPIAKFDGNIIPFDDNSFDVVMFVDVMHHLDDPLKLLLEGKRVTKRTIIIKDHLLEGILAYHFLCFMDWFGNAHHGIACPNNYFSRKQWKEVFNKLELGIHSWNEELRLYPFPVDYFFGRSLHFITSLGV